MMFRGKIKRAAPFIIILTGAAVPGVPGLSLSRHKTCFCENTTVTLSWPFRCKVKKKTISFLLLGRTELSNPKGLNRKAVQSRCLHNFLPFRKTLRVTFFLLSFEYSFRVFFCTFRSSSGLWGAVDVPSRRFQEKMSPFSVT